MYAEDTKSSIQTKPQSYGFTMYSPVRSPSSSPGKPLTMDDLSSDHHTSLRSSGEAKELADLQQKLFNMRTENSQLVSQNHRLLSELEDSSHQLLMANSKITSLHHHMTKGSTTAGQSTSWDQQQMISAVVERDAAASRVTQLEREIGSLKNELSQHQKSSSSTAKQVAGILDKERREWDMRQSEMVKQVADLQEECCRLREAHSLAEDRVLQSRAESYEPSHFLYSSGFHSFPSHSTPTQQPATSYKSHDLSLSAPTTGTAPVLRYTSVDHLLTSKGHVEPVRPFSHLRDLQEHLKESTLKSTRDALANDLERSKCQIKEFEGKVTMLDSQLKEKSTVMESYVKELSGLRNQVAKIKRNQERELNQLRDTHAKELQQVRISHSEEYEQMEAQVMQYKRSCDIKEALVSQLQTELQAVHSESQSHARNVTSLQSELEHEKLSYQEAMLNLSTEVRLGEARVTQLEKALEACRSELQGHVSKIEADSAHHEDVVRAYKHQVNLLQSELAKAHSNLEDANQEIESIQTELRNSEERCNASELSHRKCEAEMKLYKSEFEKLSSGVQQLQANNSKELANLKQQLAQSESLRNSLVQQVYSLHQNAKELTSCKEELAALHKSHCSEVGQLKGQLSSTKLELSSVSESCKSKEEELNFELRQSEAKCSELQNTLSDLQGNLSKRSQQVNDLDVALRSHQADTTSRRLQLERALTQRQADLRSRTQEVDDLKQSLTLAKETIQSATAEKEMMQSSFTKQMEKKSLKINELSNSLQGKEQQIKQLEAMIADMKKELHEGKVEQFQAEETRQVKEKHLQASKELVEKEVNKVKKQLDSVQEQHVSQMQRLQESHARALASRDQQSSAHRLQVQQMQENESRRIEELSRCRAQVTNLSAELAAERLVSEEARQQVTLLGAETARLQAQVASLQRAVGTSFTSKQQSPHSSIHVHQETMKHNISHKENTVAGSPNLSHKLSGTVPFPSHVSTSVARRTPSLSSSDTESILTSEVEFKVLPSQIATTKMPNQFDNTRRKKGDVFEV
ncbi:coiled-coil domain-containing protein 18-like isoform X2 [Dysidea avara]|uniref:coiled-coil domain-containing protein 18-like isoform X2 n=1 Tax=Dysidea avara TaxID=196820 RepID=UPI0033255BFA